MIASLFSSPVKNSPFFSLVCFKRMKRSSDLTPLNLMTSINATLASIIRQKICTWILTFFGKVKLEKRNLLNIWEDYRVFGLFVCEEKNPTSPSATSARRALNDRARLVVTRRTTTEQFLGNHCLIRFDNPLIVACTFVSADRRCLENRAGLTVSCSWGWWCPGPYVRNKVSLAQYGAE